LQFQVGPALQLQLGPALQLQQAPRTRHFLEKVTGAQVIKKTRAFYGTQSFIGDHKSSLAVSIRSHTNPVHNITPYIASNLSILILYSYSHPRSGLPRGPFCSCTMPSIIYSSHSA
jgi:hypothetical protein